MSADITEERIEATILAIRERLSFNRSIEEQTVLALYAQRNEARSQLAVLQSAPQGVDAAYLNDASLRATKLKARFGEAALLPLPQRIRGIALAVKEFATSGWERVAIADIAAEIGDCGHDVQRIAVPQGVEVPELDPGANPHQRNIENPGSFGWILNRAYRDGYNEARKNARLVPTPPQAAPGAVDVVLDPPKSDRDCGARCFYPGRAGIPLMLSAQPTNNETRG